jgi:heme-degrading monooxygenase HmoA
MYARVTQFELDTVRMPLAAALERFKERIVPALHQQPGYEGIYVLTTREGKGVLISLWADEAAAFAGLSSGFYDEQVAQFLTLLREPPGRDHYEVLYSEAAALAPA